jgi:hypothetical protein
MGRNLSTLFISQSYQFLTQISGSELQDGLGNTITGSLAITSSQAISASFATTASFALNAGTTVSTSSLLTTASAVANVITFTKGDGSTFPVTIATGSAVSSSFASTASLALNNVLTASNTDATITYTKGDGTTFTNVINNVVNATSASFATSASQAQNAVTASFALNVTPLNTGSFVTTASISNATTTFTKGDGSTFALTANNVVNANSASVAISASYATFASSSEHADFADFAFASTSASIATTASFAQNIASGLSPTFANVTASNVMITGTASVALLHTTIVSSSVIYSSGSNQFGDASNDVQTLYGTFNVVNGPSNFTGSVNSLDGFTGSLAGTASFAVSASQAQNAVSASYAPSSPAFPFTGSAQITGSLGVTGSISVLSGSFSGSVITNITDVYTTSPAIDKVITLTQAEYNAISASANPNTFYVISDSVAFNPSIYATTGSNTFIGNQIVTGSVTATTGFTGSLAGTASFATSASQAVSSSFATTASFALNVTPINTGSFATTGSNTFIGNQIITGSLTVTGSSNFTGGDFKVTDQNHNSEFDVDFFKVKTVNGTQFTGSFGVTGSVTGNVLGNNTDTFTSSAAVQQVVTLTQAEYNAIGSPNANTLYIISGSVPFNSANFATTGSNIFVGNQTISGSLTVTGSTSLQSVTITGSVTTSGTVTINNTASADYWMVDTKPFAQLSTNTIIAGRIDGADEDFVLAGRNYAGGTANAITMTDGEFIYNQTSHIFTGSVSLSSTLNVTGATTLKDDTVITGSLRGNVSALSISSNTASLDCSTGNFFTLLLVSGSNTFVNPSNINPGQTINLRVKQASVASGSISFASSIKQVSGSLYTPTATANGEDIVTFISFDSTNLYLSNVKNFV